MTLSERIAMDRSVSRRPHCARLQKSASFVTSTFVARIMPSCARVNTNHSGQRHVSVTGHLDTFLGMKYNGASEGFLLLKLLKMGLCY